MAETLLTTIEYSFQIAWDYLEATGELGDPDTAANHLLDTIETMVRRGERHRLLLSNKAIAAYQRFRAFSSEVDTGSREENASKHRV